jgi:hypothetical protein
MGYGPCGHYQDEIEQLNSKVQELERQLEHAEQERSLTYSVEGKCQILTDPEGCRCPKCRAERAEARVAALEDGRRYVVAALADAGDIVLGPKSVGRLGRAVADELRKAADAFEERNRDQEAELSRRSDLLASLGEAFNEAREVILAIEELYFSQHHKFFDMRPDTKRSRLRQLIDEFKEKKNG